MRIERVLGASKSDVLAKKYNIWIGTSLGNKYFTQEHIKAYILWALEYTREDVLIVIPDRIHAINLEVLDGYTKLRAFRVAMRKANEKEIEINHILNDLSPTERSRVHVARWNEVTGSKYHAYRTEIIFDAFAQKGAFYDFILSIVKANYKNSPHTLTQARLEKLATYVLYEIPLFLNGVKHGVYRAATPAKGGKKYDLITYPGLNAFDTLLIGLQEGTLFPELAQKLKITEKIVIVEGYVD